jgi:homoserine O-acetyltransferase
MKNKNLFEKDCIMIETNKLKTGSNKVEPVSNILSVSTKIEKLYDDENPLKLESGEIVPRVQVAYQTYGKLNESGDNAILICHALTGNAHAAGILAGEEFDSDSNPDLLNQYSKVYAGKPGWWDPLIGPDKVFDTNKFFVICPNFIGSCYGSTGPLSSYEGKKYGAEFPVITVRDMVRVQKKLLDFLGVSKLKTISGGSLGGMQVLEWLVLYPHLVDTAIPIATSTAHSPWAVSLNQAAREAIRADGQFNNGNYREQPYKGLALARRIAMISYRSFDSFGSRFGRERVKTNNSYDVKNKFQIESYLDHHGDKILERFDANTYITITYAMDYHDISRDRGDMLEVLNSIKQPVLSLGISTDVLYPAKEQQEYIQHLENGHYSEIQSLHGHDAFLIEFDQLTTIINNFIERYF